MQICFRNRIHLLSNEIRVILFGFELNYLLSESQVLWSNGQSLHSLRIGWVQIIILPKKYILSKRKINRYLKIFINIQII